MKIPDHILNDAISLARRWQDRANDLLTREERRNQKKMMRLLRHPMDKVVLTKMIDQSFRADNPARVADQVNFVLRRYGVPAFFLFHEQFLMRLFLALGRHFPKLSVPQMIERMREDSARAVVPGEADALYPHLRKRKSEGVRMNINHIGEVVLGEEEAEHRLKSYVDDLENPEIEYISVKISTIYSQISGLALEQTVEALKERLTRLFGTAEENTFVHKDGRRSKKFVNLDMEEYRDLEITSQAFIRTLNQPEFKDHAAGIVLQAYLPDSFAMQQELTKWAVKRVADGGAPIKIRIVKGANMEMELVEAATYNWPLAPYDNKLDVDANYKRMVDYGMQPENIRAVHMGIASHNLFELAYAFKLAQHYGVTQYFTFEMLEGMADHIRRAIQEMSGEVLLYAPVASREQFINAIAYLIRRLDENTAEENFLRYSFNLTTDSKEWRFLEERFVASCHQKDKAKIGPNRVQDRNIETFPEEVSPYYDKQFLNEPDTDWSLSANRKWAQGIREKWKKNPGDAPIEVPLVVAGEEIFSGRDQRDYLDPNQYHENVLTAKYALANDEDAEKAVAAAKADPDGWRQKSHEERWKILADVAMELRKARGDLNGAASANTGKVFTETDPEVSEAVDFTEFYPWTAEKFINGFESIKASPKGVGLVISPWNFPVAIPTGGMIASLAAGNTVIFKPASSAILVGWEICKAIWRGGVSKNTLQFLPCSGAATGKRLTEHPDVDYIILTGGTDTGMSILKQRPDAYLAAETGGKNATIVTEMGDRDQAIKNVLHSAFSNCGQKCSATSLLILEPAVFNDENFKRQLVDAAKSYPVGSSWNFKNKMAPMIQPPKDDLLRALTTLEPGETWALKPQMVDDNPYLWTPGIKWDVTPGSYTHMTEFFGPLLGVIRADDLDHAIELVNMTGYGLTSGLESLDRREQAKWKAGIKAGNLYINRGTTGAVVLRQPFGGMGKSALGAGIKAGSPNYVFQFMDYEETGYPAVGAIKKDYRLLEVAHHWRKKIDWGEMAGIAPEINKTIRAILSYLYHYEDEFSVEKDYFNIRGQDNLFRYLPVGTVVVRVHPDDTLFEVLARIAAARIAGCILNVSIPPDLNNEVVGFLEGEEGKRFMPDLPISRATDDELIKMMPKAQRFRYAAADRVPMKVFEAAAKTGFYIARTPVMMEGRIELLHYIQEQAISNSYHRYGNLGERGLVR